MKSIIAGATGLIGKALLNLLIHSDSHEQIEIWVRKPSAAIDHRFTESVLAFEELPDIPEVAANHLYCTLGTTIRKAKTKENFYRVDVTYVVSLAKLAERSGITCFLVISSIGANPASLNFYLRTKGEMEEAVTSCSIPSIYILRPSMLLGKRDEKRSGENVGKILSKIAHPFMFGSLRKYRAIHAESVARAMIRCARESKPGIHILESDDIHRLGNMIM